jgi:predicted transcriptional regulator
MIYTRKLCKNNGESIFLEKFLDSNFFESLTGGGKYFLLQEPYTGLGFTDLVCIIWDRNIEEEWTEKRNNLTLNDIKILHHLYNNKVYKSIDEISRELNFSFIDVLKSIEKLNDAELIVANNKNKVKIRKIKEIFFVKKIISIEAKLRNWRKALEQSFNNTLFSSQSYILFPQENLTKNLIKTYNDTSIGIISFSKSYSVVKKAKKQRIPAALTSWLFNEYIGRYLLW